MSPEDVKSLLQLPRTPSHWLSVDTLDLINELKVPTSKWNTTNIPEPITFSYPEWGLGGGTQVMLDRLIKIENWGKSSP